MVLTFLVVVTIPESASVFNHRYPGPGNMYFKNVFTANNIRLGEKMMWLQVDTRSTVSNLVERPGLTFLI